MTDDIRSKLKQNVLTWDGFLALGLGSGLAPRAPGTFGTLAAIPPAILLQQLDFLWLIMVLVTAFIMGIVVCGRVGKRIGVSDHGAIVWDEFLGFWLCLLVIPKGWLWLGLAFLVFRVFDIFKPWPIGWVERKVSGGLGVMIDDVLAAGYSMIILLVLQRFID